MGEEHPEGGKPFSLCVPAVVDLDATKERLVWRWDEGHQWKAADNKMLGVFVGLADAPTTQIRLFARRYGPLLLCKHGLPMYHNWWRESPDSDLLHDLAELGLLDNRAWEHTHEEECEPQQLERRDAQTGEVQVWTWEPLAAWRHYARKARAILAVTEPLTRGWLAKEPHLRTLDSESGLRMLNALEELDRPNHKPVEYNLDWHKLLVRKHLERWLVLGRVIPRVEWDSPTPRVRCQPSGLFGALALALAARAGMGHLATCANCGMIFTRERAVSRNLRNFCDNCKQQGAPHKLAMRDRRARIRREKESSGNV